MASFRDLSDEQLVHHTLERERDLVQARFRHSMNQLENTAHLSKLRKEIARLKTEARTREAAMGVGNGRLAALHAATYSSATNHAAATPDTKGGFLSGIVDKLSSKD